MRFRTAHSVTVGLGAVTLGTALLAAACSSGQTNATSTQEPSGNATVSVRRVDGAATLVAPSGRVLYTNNQDRPGHPMCTSSGCTAVWKPLTVKGARPMAGTAVTGRVASVALRDGERQVTWKGMPLYTFSFDHGPGQAGGDGFHDSFGGTSFVWSAAVTRGHMTAPSSGGSGGYSSGGSGYSSGARY